MQTKFEAGTVIKQCLIITLFIVLFSCKKENTPEDQPQIIKPEVSRASRAGESNSNYNLEVVLRGLGNQSGHIHFRQDPDVPKIITLDTKVHHLEPNHEYLLQRAVDKIINGECTGTNWLTLGRQLQPLPIVTDKKGNGQEILSRDLSVVPSGTTFDIHFRLVDKLSLAVVLTSGCYKFTVR